MDHRSLPRLHPIYVLLNARAVTVTDTAPRVTPFTTRPTLRGWFGMSASTHWVATGTAQSVLERGGNAFDAAAAAAFTLHVVEPHLNGPGGDLVAIFATVDYPNPRVLMGQGPAPANATITHFEDEGLDRVPGAGGLAAAVPGAVEAWLMLLAQHGTWELDEILAYAIDYAERGFRVAPKVSSTIAAVSGIFRQHWPTSADAWLRDGKVPAAHSVLTNPGYGRTLRRLIGAGEAASSRVDRIDAARREWRTSIAQEAASFIQAPHWHSTGTEHAGVLTADDWAAFRASVEPALTSTFRGHTIAKAGWWSQGPVLLQMLAILDTFDDSHLDLNTALGIHTVAEAIKLAMADRDAYYGDAQYSEEQLALLLTREYARLRASQIDAVASKELRPGSVGLPAFHPRLIVEEATGGEAGEPTVDINGETRGDTCHVDVVDRHGNMISATPSGGWLQSSPAIPSLGFCLGSRLQMTWLDPASPSRLEPGRRPRTTLSPTLLLRDGVPVGALGTPGGDQQDQWQLLYLLRTLVEGLSPQAAIDAPMFHTTSFPSSFWPRSWNPGQLVIEDRVPTGLANDLRTRGHDVTAADAWSLGRLSTVGRDPDTGELSAAANPRGALGYAAGR
jgi:gamma-glutamyltranspeptidase/glutathione hydrolase